MRRGEYIKNKYIPWQGLFRSKGWTYTLYWAMKDEVQPYFIKNKPSAENPPDIEMVLRSVGNKPTEELEPNEYFSDDEYIHFQAIGAVVKVNTDFVNLFKKTKAQFYQDMDNKRAPVQVIVQKDGIKELIGVIMPIYNG